MANRREKMKEALGGQSDYPKLDITRRYDLRSEDGLMQFRYYDTEKEENVFSRKPIQGVLLGSANILSAFDDDLGAKGGTYFSSPYFSNTDKIVILGRDKGASKISFRGSVEDAEGWLAANTTSGRASKKKILFILTLGGVVSIETNMTIAIDQMNQMKDSFLDYLVKVTPHTYDPENPGISKRAQDFLGKFAKKNPPKFAKIELSTAINDEIWEQLGGDAALEMYIAWKKHISAGKEAVVEDHPIVPEVKTKITAEGERMASASTRNVNYEDIDKLRGDDNEDNDLPF